MDLEDQKNVHKYECQKNGAQELNLLAHIQIMLSNINSTFLAIDV